MKQLLLISIILVICCSFTCTALGVVDTPEQAFSIVKSDVLEGTRGDLPVYVSDSVFPAGTVIRTFKGPFMTLDAPAWFAFIDLHPGANWEHECLFVLIDPISGESQSIEATRPPENINKLKHFQGVDIFGGKNVRPVSSVKSFAGRSIENCYAVILSGGASSGSNHVRYWNDCSSIYKTLVDTYGYLDENIIVAISDGTNPAPDQSNGGNSDPDLDGDGDDDIMYSCIRTNLNTIFSNLASTLDSSDTLFIFTTDHGNGQSGVPGQPTSMNLWNSEEIWDYEFAALLEPIQCREMILTLEPCFSGGFVNDVIDMNSTVPRVISTAANDHEYSWAMPPDYVYDTYVFHWTAAINWEDAYGNPVDADTNNDGEITMDEAYAYALDMDEDDEHPQYGEWPTGYGATLTMTGSGPTSDGTVKLKRDLYNCDDMIIITVEDLDLLGSGSVDVTIVSSSETTPETVSLAEVSDGRFEGTIATATGTPAADGILQVSPDDTITVSYYDENYGGAGPYTVTDTASVDCTQPVISNVMIADVSESSFIVTWTTSEPATSVVYYSDSPAPGIMMEDSDLVTDHSMNVTGLSDCTYYYVAVESTDAAANMASDDNGGAYYGVQTLELVTLLEANMDSDPGWTYENQWAWGVPTGSGGDPSSGYTGSSVVGYNLSGTYPNNLPQTHCTTQAFDCSTASQVYLSFWKWLGVESSTWDHASISASGDNGSSWTVVWDHTGSSTLPTSWSYVEYDISAVAAGNSQVKIRWTMGATDSSVVYCGWNIDDVLVSYTLPCTEPTPTPYVTCNHDGDVTCDGSITAGDAQLAFLIALGAYTPNEEENCAADCNEDGSCTAGDAQMIFMTALGTASCMDPM
ncbi:caspase family protein [bacterium]|nr:caspase family protein [candidate division CSSED10-310 bacterium]